VKLIGETAQATLSGARRREDTTPNFVAYATKSGHSRVCV
jgi:hypothetical protein